jgi:hypothetical protein
MRTTVVLPDFMRGRWEHQLIVVGRVGDAQIECVTFSEPLAFAHANVSDEYALLLPFGDPLLDAMQGRTFLSRPDTGDDVARYKHGCLDLVLHPHGLMHWPGRLRRPYEPFAFPPGARRRGLSLVFSCAAPRTPGERPLNGDDPSVPMFLANLRTAAPGLVGVVGDARLTLHAAGETVDLPCGGYVIDPVARTLTLAHGAIPLDTRALVLASDVADAAPPPPVPEPPFAPFEDAPRGSLPIEIGQLRVDADAVSIGGVSRPVPRLWLARLLFRAALHGFRLGYVETYDGFFVNDLDPTRITLGLRGSPFLLRVPREEAMATIERLYRAVAPEGYTERLPD